MTYELVLDNSKMLANCFEESPLSSVCLYPGAIDNFPNPGEDLIEFGSVWNDSSDATYASFGYSEADTGRGAHGVIDTYTGGLMVSMTLHFRASCTGSINQPLFVEIHRPGPGYTTIMRFLGGSSIGEASTDPFYGPGANWDIPNDGVIRDYAVSVDTHMLEVSGWDNIDEMREDLAGGGVYLYFWPDSFYDEADPVPTGVIRIYEARVCINEGL